MNTPRYNSFNQIHKGLRTFLYDTALLIQRTDLSHPEKGEEVMQQTEQLLSLFESHAHGEDHFFNEPLEKTDSQIAKMFEKEHEQDHWLGQVITDLILQWRNESTDEGRKITGRRLFYAFNEFIAFNLYHMNKEEIELNSVLWERYTDGEIKAIEQSLVAQVPPPKMAAYAKWMMRGMNDTELIHWFQEVREFAPAPMFGLLTGILRAELSVERIAFIERKLNETVKKAA